MFDPKEQMNHKQTSIWQHVVQKYAKLSNYELALDIGTSSGMSAWSIAKSGTGYVISIDEEDKVKAAQEMAEREEIGERISFLQIDSEKFFENNSNMFEFICVDGSHRKNIVFKDACSGWDFLKPGGYMVFDDYGHQRYGEDVQWAVSKFLTEHVKEGHTFRVEDGKGIIHKHE